MRLVYAFLLVLSTASPAYAPEEYAYASPYEIVYWTMTE